MRYQSLDIFKALGIIYLVCLHQLGWFFTNNDGNNLRFDEAIQIVFPLGFRTGLHVLGLQIPLLAGVTHYLSVRKKNLMFKDVFIRGMMLIIAGYVMNFLAWGVEDLWAWDVLQFIGLSLIISYPFLKNKGSLLLLFFIGTIALLFSNQFPFPQASDNYFYKIFIGDVDGYNYWPMCPWFFVFVIGVYFGKDYFEQKKNEKVTFITGALFLFASIISGQYHPGLDWNNVWGKALFKPTIFFVCGIVGFSYIAIPLTEKALIKLPIVRKILANEVLLYLGKNIFWIYIFSTMIGYRGTTLFIIQFPDMSYHQTVAAYVIFIVLNLFICYHMVKLKDIIHFKMAKD